MLFQDDSSSSSPADSGPRFSMGHLPMRGITKALGGLAVCGVLLMTCFQLFEQMDASEIMVVQSPMGSLSVYTDAGDRKSVV